MNLSNRREVVTFLASFGITSPVFARALMAQSDEEKPDGITTEQIKAAEWISGIELTEEQREKVLSEIQRNDLQNRRLRDFEVPHNIGPAVHFRTLAKQKPIGSLQRQAQTISNQIVALPETDDEIAFLPVKELSWLIRARKISSQQLTTIYLRRLRKYSGMLRCVVNLTEDLAVEQSRRADEELARGIYRGPLHGIPWGAKDLIEVPGYPTTWGIPHCREQRFDNTATVAKRLEEAGAVLVAKLSLGALAMGDKWFGGMTRNPWNPKIGSSGSSAGSASASVAGLVGFSLGSETLGSIISPSIRCGATGFRPTFGRVSRAGCMPLSWSMDKIGPICRSVEDCALVFDAIHGEDGLDPTVSNFPFRWPNATPLAGIRVGYEEEKGRSAEDRKELRILKRLGCELVKIKLNITVPAFPLASIISVEGASVFDQLLREGHTEGWNTWPESFRAANQISAVDYVRYQRIRSKLMNEFEEQIKDVDILVNVRDLVFTNFTGHPSVVMPLHLKKVAPKSYRPEPLKLTGHLNEDDKLLKVANAVQDALVVHRIRPDLDYWLNEFKSGTLDEEKQDDAE